MLRDFQKTRIDSYRVKWLKLKIKSAIDVETLNTSTGNTNLLMELLVTKCGKRVTSTLANSPKERPDPAKVVNVCIEALMGKVERIVGEISPTNKNPIDFTRDYVAKKNITT